MKLGMVLRMAGAHYDIDMDLVREVEEPGYDSIWTSEAWGSDAISPAAWVLAQTSKIKVGTGIIQMPTRTPALAAMTAMTLQDLSGGRSILGIGPLRPAGDRGLARLAIRSTADPDPGICRHRP